MATTASGVTIPGSSPTTTAATPIQDHWNNLGKSLNGKVIVPVASVTARAALLVALAAEGYTPSTSTPVYVQRADAPAGCEQEVTVDGVVWRSFSSSWSRLDTTNALVPTIRQWGIVRLAAPGGTPRATPLVVTFPVAFSGVPHVTAAIMGFRLSGAYNPSGMTIPGADAWLATATGRSTTAMTLNLYDSSSATIAAGYDLYVSWEAVGPA